MHNTILHVVLLFLAGSKSFANPAAKEIVKSNIEPLVFHSHVDIIKTKRASKKPPLRPWCRAPANFEPVIQGPLPVNPSERRTDPPKPKNPNSDHPKDECPLPEYSILVTCPTDSRFPPGGADVVTIGDYDYWVFSRLQQCSPGELRVKFVILVLIGHNRDQDSKQR